VGSILLDGSAISVASFAPIGASGFSGAQVPVTLGTHNLSGPLPFGAFMYGFASFDSYGYPGGQSLAQVAVVTSIVLSPLSATNPVGTQHCVDALVRDQNNVAVPGVRVDFTVTGVNPNTGFGSANANGVAQFCYTGSNAGTDTIVGAVGQLQSNRVTKLWTSAVAICDVDRDGDIDQSDLSLISRARGQAAQPGDPRDSDFNGSITPNDVKVCIKLCTRPNCAIQ
jgi:Bacterial Ig-like domain (group 1)